LLVEDEPIIALDLEIFLNQHGYEVAGPFSSVFRTLQELPSLVLAGAIVDINVHGEMTFPVADRLSEVGTPFVWVSGNSRDLIPARFRKRPFFPKPFRRRMVLDALEMEMSGRQASRVDHLGVRRH
jgi:hypothetical protein